MSSEIEKRLEGTRDMLPEDHNYLTFLKKVFRHEFRKNGFRRISTPLIEQESLLRKVYPVKNDAYGIYHFENESQVNIALTPGGTVGIIRSYIENQSFEELQPVYYYFMERSFRKSRLRKEFYEIGGEIIGESDPIIDAQNVYMIYSALTKIGLSENIKIRINSLGNAKEMEKYKLELESFFENKTHIMSSKTQERFQDTVFAPFFSREEDDIILAKSAPNIQKFLKKDSKAAYEAFKMYLGDLQIPFEEDTSLLFPEEFYSGVLWQVEDVQGNILATGGRYDTLAKMLGSPKEYPAAGFSVDVGHIIDDLKSRNISLKNKDQIDLYFVQLGDEAKRVVFPLSLEARAKGINTLTSLGTPSIKEQMLKAQRIGAKFIVIVGVMEARNGVFQVRDTEHGTQAEIKKEELIDYIIERIGKEKLDFYEPSRDLVQG